MKYSNSMVEEFKNLSSAYAKKKREFEKKFSTNPTGEELKLIEAHNPSTFFTPKFGRFLFEHINEPIAEDAAIWLVTEAPHDKFDNYTNQAFQLLSTKFANSEKLLLILWPIERNDLRKAAMMFVAQLYQRSDNRQIRGLACLILGLRASQEHPDVAIPYLKEVSEKYSDIDVMQKSSAGKIARKYLYELEHLQPGCSAPATVGVDVDGKPIQLSDFKGKVVWLLFFGNWCGSCMHRLPTERKIAKQYKDQDLVLLGIDCRDSNDILRSMIKDGTVTFPTIWEAEKDSLINTWNVTSFPSLWLIDRNGIIQYHGSVEGAAKRLPALLERS